MIVIGKGKFAEWITPEGITKIEGWARDGLIDAEIAQKMGITRSTFYAWKSKYPVISDALKKGKEVIDYEVEKKLLTRALGYEYTEVSTEFECGVQTKYKETKKHVPPDVTAQIFWLKNRKPEQWRDKVPDKSEDEALDGVVIMNDLPKS